MPEATVHRRPATPRGGGGVQTVVALDRARRLTEPMLRAALDRLDPHTRDVCSYHFGFGDADGGAGTGSGKYLRPALALLSARAAGAASEQGVPAAAAVELLHNFSLLHDDVMDGDAERRHQPAVWARFGVPTAILAGDALLSLANDVLSEAPSPRALQALRMLNATTRRMIAGQSADLSFEEDGEVSLARCLRMAADKTGALLGCAASLGAVLVDAPAGLVLGLSDYGARVGLAFQLTDDLLGIWGEPERTGKPAWSDLRARKKSLPIAAALESRSPAGERLRRLYRQHGEFSDTELEQAATLVELAGGRRWAARKVDEELTAAVATLEGLSIPREVRDELAGLTGLLGGRQH